MNIFWFILIFISIISIQRKGSIFSNGDSNNNLDKESRSPLINEQLYLLPDRVDYKSAVKFCKSQGMNLVKILDESSNRVVSAFAKTKGLEWYWIDANDIETEGQWVHSDGSKMVYSKWYSGEPNNVLDEDCAQGFFKFYNENWYDNECHINSDVICVKERFSATLIPQAPSNIAILDKSTTSIKLGWSLSTRSGNYGPAQGYEVTMNGGEFMRRRIHYASTNYIVFHKLHQCRLHCFELASFNTVYRSADSARICTNTTMEFEKVELSPMKADFPVTRLVSWRYNNFNNCPVIFEVEYSVDNDINVFLLKSITNNIQLTGMERDQMYSVKVHPTFDGNKGEFSSTKHFHTFRDPVIPSDVRFVNTTPTTISLQWDKSEKTDAFGPAQKYIITIYNKTMSTKYNTSMESHNFNDLRQCSYYCFTVVANNLAGTTTESSPICGNTSTYFDEMNLVPGKYQFSTSPTIKWTYNNTYKCKIVFYVEYYMKNYQNQVFSNETSDTQIILDNLSTNDIYVVRVRPMFGIWSGRFSTSRLLYTKIGDLN